MENHSLRSTQVQHESPEGAAHLQNSLREMQGIWISYVNKERLADHANPLVNPGGLTHRKCLNLHLISVTEHDSNEYIKSPDFFQQIINTKVGAFYETSRCA